MKTIIVTNRRILLSMVVFFIFSAMAIAQPAWSRGEQLLPITFEEAMKRADAALKAEGFVNLQNQANFIAGYQGNSTAIIMCNNAPDGKQWINIVVMNSTDNSMPGGQRVNLQNRMNNPSTTVTNQPIPSGTIDWAKQADFARGKNGERYTFTCIPNGSISSRVWGTDLYTDDSSICSCAVHAGLITTAYGGTVTIQIVGPQTSFTGSTRYGVTSNSYGSWYGGFVFVK